MFRPYMWAIFRLTFNLQISYTRCVGRFGWGNEISLGPKHVVVFLLYY